MGVTVTRLTIAGLSGDSGKTIVSLALMAALRRRGLTVAPFKKGPDYIDPAWLSEAAGATCRNLDTFLADADTVRRSFIRHARKADIAVVEGNRGLFDGKDTIGSHSTAGLARLLQSPLLLVVDTTKTTRTIAALVKGCLDFEPNTPIAGVILNKIAGKRHQRIITDSIETYCHLPVLGAIPKLGNDADIIPGRHLGLVPPTEFMAGHNIREKLEQIAEKYLNLDRILSIAKRTIPLPDDLSEEQTNPTKSVRVGFFSDSVFTFYYPENLEALEHNGAELIPVSSLADSTLPEIDALYIGGGFPETHAKQLVSNRSLMESVKSASEKSLPIYAECGGLIYLCRSLKWKNDTFPMAGVFPVDLEMSIKPVGHGYTEAVVDEACPYFEPGMAIRGHEFHYSGVVSALKDNIGCLTMKKGVGLGNGRDGLMAKNTMACYTHIHADGIPSWASSLVSLARDFAIQSKQSGGGGISSSFRIACR